MGLGSPAITPRVNIYIPLLPTFTRKDVVAWASRQPRGQLLPGARRSRARCHPFRADDHG